MADQPGEDRAPAGAPPPGADEAPTAQPAVPAPKNAQSHTGRLLLWSWLTPLFVISALVAGLLIWAGNPGSLATALRMAEARLPQLHASGVSGAILGGGRVERLTWKRDGLTVQVDGLVLDWAPRALLKRTLDIRRLAADRVVVADHRPASSSPSKPPSLPLLPLALRVDSVRAGEIEWAGPPALTLQNVVARVATHGLHYQLDVENADFDHGKYQARAVIGALHPMTLDVTLNGALVTPAVGGLVPRPVALRATLTGPVTNLLAQADVRVQGASTTDATPPAPGATQDGKRADRTKDASASSPAPPKTIADDAALQARARITPWQRFPIADARATLQTLDLGALSSAAPRTALSGELNIAPDTDADHPGWTIQAHLANAAAGPWDRHQLPISRVSAAATWSESAGALVQALDVDLAGGTLQAQGRWGPAPHDPKRLTAESEEPVAATTGTPWQVEAHLKDVHPARILTSLADTPISGSVNAEGSAASPIRFNIALDASGRPESTRDRQPASTAHSPIPDLRTLRLRNLDARGEWDHGLLTLANLRVRTDDAELAGRAQLRPADPAELGGSADVRFTAPGANATVKGELLPRRGTGSVKVSVSDAARLLAWARTLPGMAHALAGIGLNGQLNLDGQWRGGWRDPALQAQAIAPSLNVKLPSGSANDAPIELRGVNVNLDGRLSQAQLSTRGSLQQGKRQIRWQVAADGGRTAARATLAESSWRMNLKQLQLSATDPLLGAGTWQAATTGAVDLTWAKGTLDAAPGALRITSPAPASHATFAWERTRWRRGELSTSGRLTGLPLAWWTHFQPDAKKSGSGVTGNLVFDGDWNIQAGRDLQAKIDLERASGDLTILATDAETDVQSRVSAGVRAARVQLIVDGGSASMNALWDSERAGHVEGTLRTQLMAARDKHAAFPWTWTESAPIEGQISARLPTISTWSILAPPGWRLRGAVSADVRIAGTAAAPQLSGTLTAEHLALRSVVDGVQLQDGQLRAHLDGTRLVLDEFILHGPGASGSGGTVSATGEAGWIGGQLEARLSTTLAQLRASVRDDRQVTVSGQFDTAFKDRLVSASGTIRVDHALIVLPDSSRPTLGSDVVVHGAGWAEDSHGAPKATGNTAPAPANADNALDAKVDVKIDLGDDFELKGMGIATRLAGTLALTADGPLAQMPTLKGRVQTEGGRFQAYGQTLAITRGRIFFSGNVTNPGLDILALRPNYSSDQKVGVQIQGTALLPQVSLYSDPALPDNQTLAWLLLGHAAPQNGGEAAMMQSAALALLGGRESRGLASTFGLDELSFSQNTNSATGQSGNSLTLGKRLSDRLYAAYEQGLGGATSVLMIFYELSKRWVIRGQAGANSAVDLIFRLSYGSGE